MAKRKIIKIDKEKCDGCGLCIPACPEGALQLIDGKAKLVSDKYCDGLGACLGECPQGAISFEEREADEFDEEAVKEKMKKAGKTHHHPAGASCPSKKNLMWKGAETAPEKGRLHSALEQWPIQLMLVNPSAPYFEDADLVLAADCVPFAYANFHPEFLAGKAVAIGCPKLDDANYYVEKLTDILKINNIKSLTVVNMEVPCCFGLLQIARSAVKASGKQIPLKQIIVSIQGEIK
jgi:NAD-dependent dihydropyrimidine dehydrogenase PreA subunit